jgi:hypothetical protein
MTLCDDGHQEVCFDGRTCPVCTLIKEKDAELEGKDNEIQSLHARIDELENQG